MKRKIDGQLVGYQDHFDKIESYIGTISAPAMERYPVSPYTFRVVETVPDSVFKFHDTLTSRAEITDLAAKFKNDVVAVIGLGGTGAYLLDFLVKTPVREIRAFDGDTYHVHTAFRSPGHVEEAEFRRSKAQVYGDRYENFRTGLTFDPTYVDSSCGDKFNGVTFAFVCIDKGSARAEIFDVLLAKGIPFIDVGLGLKRRDGALTGMIRTTYCSPEEGQRVRDKGLAEFKDQADDVYRTTVQIAELNALNAALAIIKFKQLRGFYLEEIPYYHLLFAVNDLKTVGFSKINEDS